MSGQYMGIGSSSRTVTAGCGSILDRNWGHADGVFAPMPLVGFVDLNLDCKVQRLAMANPHTSVKAPQARRAEQNEQRPRRPGLDRGCPSLAKARRAGHAAA